MTGAVLRAVAPSPFATVQDTGRIGWRRYGLASAGAMDPEALAVANALVGNLLDAACVEFAHAGGMWDIGDAPRRIAVAGGSFAVSIDGAAVPHSTSLVLRPGQSLLIGGTRDAVWGYLAVGGGILVPREFGSRATHARSGVGGLEGRALMAGDEVPLAADPPAEGSPEDTKRTIPMPPRSELAPIRVVLGPQHDRFATGAVESLLASSYRVTWQCDRMGYRLEGPPLAHAGGFNIVSDGLLPGSIQVPGNGQPIVLLMDAQTTGGYPKIATIVTADLGRFAQSRPRSEVRFEAVSLDDAQLLRREYAYRLRATHLRAYRATPPTRQPHA